MRKGSAKEDTTYNGWANWETWNVALWIGNDEGLYSLAKAVRYKREPYRAFVEDLKEFGNGEIIRQTPDGARWDDPVLDTDALDEMMEEL